MKAITLRSQQLDIMSLGSTLAQSGYFADTREAAQAIVKVLAGQELGLGPIASMTSIYIINGRPSLSANAMAAVIKNHPAYDYKVRRLTNEVASIEFFEKGESLGMSDFSLEDANRAGLTAGRNAHSWKNYPRNMLFARALSNGARWYCPDAFSGVPPYTPEEFDAIVDGETGEIIQPADNGNGFELETQNRQDKAPVIDPITAFYDRCLADFGLTGDVVDDILAAYKVRNFNPARIEKYVKAIEAQMTSPTCDPALLAVVNRETGGHYENIYRLKNAVNKVDPDFSWPAPLKDAEQWQVARALAVEYANVPMDDYDDPPPIDGKEAGQTGW